MDMFTKPPEHGKPVKIQNGEYIYFPNFYNEATADKYFKRLIEDIKWKQESMKMFGVHRYPDKFILMNGNSWISMKIIEMHGCQWASMNIYGYP